MIENHKYPAIDIGDALDLKKKYFYCVHSKRTIIIANGPYFEKMIMIDLYNSLNKKNLKGSNIFYEYVLIKYIKNFFLNRYRI